MMKTAIRILLLSALACGPASASDAEIKLDEAHVNLHDMPSLQRGAKYFVNYCMSCHSAAYSRYNRVGQDLRLTDEQVEANLIFTGAKVGDLMTVTMSPGQAKQWFGSPAPDLSLVARSRGSDWLFTYLRAFYRDESRPFGVNNLVYPNVAMPHVLAGLQGIQKKRETGHQDTGHEAGHGAAPSTADLELVEPGALTPREYDRAIRDLVSFMTYLSEPAQTRRRSMGLWVIGFLALLFAVSYAMKREYWKDVH
jgi:ubiquinol-cytochrome c reductase cytochrome c1 subunit